MIVQDRGHHGSQLAASRQQIEFPIDEGQIKSKNSEMQRDTQNREQMKMNFNEFFNNHSSMEPNLKGHKDSSQDDSIFDGQNLTNKPKVKLAKKYASTKRSTKISSRKAPKLKFKSNLKNNTTRSRDLKPKNTVTFRKQSDGIK